MDADLNNEVVDKKLDRPWTTDEIRKHSANWTLAGDVGLYNFLTDFAQNIISRTHEVENAVESLVFKTKMANVKICNAINDFHMLSNVQFVENRVYDEEVLETKAETKPVEKTKEQKESEMLPNLIKAVELGLQVLDQAFNKINVEEISDSEDEDMSSEGRTVLEAKDPFEGRPLPFIIGSEEFQNSDYAGLQDLMDEDVEYVSDDVESSTSESEESSTDQDDVLPLNDDKFVGLSKPSKLTEEINNRYSSSEESDLFGSEKEENGFVSDSSSFESRKKDEKNIQVVKKEAQTEVRKSRQASVASIQSKLKLPQVLPTSKPVESKNDSDDLFANDLFANDEVSDDDSPFHKKSGLFSSDLQFGNEEKDMFDSDLFNDISKEKKTTEAHKPTPVTVKSSPTVKKSNEPGLFDNDEDSDDDIFNKIMKTKPSHKEESPKLESPDKADSSSTPSSAPSSKPSGNAFDFISAGGNTDALFGEESDADDLFATKSTQKKIEFTTAQDDGEDDEDDLFGSMSKKSSSKSKVVVKTEQNPQSSSLFDQSDNVAKPLPAHKKLGQPLPGLVSSKTADSLFQDNETKKSANKASQLPSSVIPTSTIDPILEDSNTKKSVKKIGQPLPGLVTKKHKDSLFEDSDSSDREENLLSSPALSTPAFKKKNSLFDDDDADDDIFSQAPKKLLSPGKSPSLITKPQLQNETKVVAPAKPEKSIGLFDNDGNFSMETEHKPTLSMTKGKSKDLSLFDDSGDFDLFNQKSIAKTATSSVLSSQENDDDKDDDIFKFPKPNDVPVKKETVPFAENIPPKMVEDVSVTDNSSAENATSPEKSTLEISPVGFDVPVDTSKTLHVVNKERARISAKRRKPTKKSRLAAVENINTAKENTLNSNITEQKASDDLFQEPESSVTTQSPDGLFSAEPLPVPAAHHKTQEKQKMNLMSQLMSEAAASRIGKKLPSPVEILQNDEDEDIDLFAEAVAMTKDRTRSRGFSFLSPIESTSTTTVPDEEGDTTSLTNPVEDLVDENEDLFTGSSFRNFSNSISHKASVLDLDDDDDDLFSSIKTSSLPKAKVDASENDIFSDDTDIFADIQKEKYEMFPSQLYDNDDDDDIFSTVAPSSSSATSSKSSSSINVKKEAEKKPVNTFEDPLSGLLNDD